MTFENIKDIEAMILSIVTGKIDRGDSVYMSWTVGEILASYSEISGQDKEFYLITARDWVYKKVKRSVDKLEASSADSTNPQMKLEGFDHLQKAYTVKRDESRVLVPIHLLSNDELESRAMQYESMAQANINHAKEIRMYRNSRQQTA